MEVPCIYRLNGPQAYIEIIQEVVQSLLDNGLYSLALNTYHVRTCTCSLKFHNNIIINAGRIYAVYIINLEGAWQIIAPPTVR